MEAATISLNQLESHLWESANILRGPVDAADFKSYVFPLLFFKRICDVHDEEYQAALKESGGDEEYARFPQNYRFDVPEDCHWSDVRAVTSNVGQKLQKAMRGIEKANPDTLYGIFGDAQWTNKDRLSDSLLRDIIEHFSRINLANQTIEGDILGQSYEYLIKKFADATNKKAGEFYTPRPVVRLMVNILNPKEGESIYDPACGTGGMLLEAVLHVKSNRGDDRTLWGRLFAQEKNLTTSAIARMNLFLHGASDFQVVRGDTLRSPAFFLGDGLATFDCVIANPPFSLEKWGEEVWASDPYGRNFAGMPPGKSGDYAWVQHMIKSMSTKTGRMAVVLPHGALFRMGKEGEIREKILGMDLLEAVIGLGPNLFYGTGLAACILVFRQCKVKDRKNKVLILDASNEFKTGRAQNELLPEHVERIYGWYRDYADVAGIARVVTLDDIAANDHNLNIPRCVEPKNDQVVLTVDVLQGARDWMTGDVPQHGDLDDHHIVPDAWCKKNVKGGLGNSILNRTPLTADTNRHVIKARLPNEYLPELIQQNGEATVRGILESHFISPTAFDILMRAAFGTDDFEAFVAERQRTLQDAIENLLIKERLDLPPQLRNLDAATEQVELAVRKVVDTTLGSDLSQIPSHVLQKVDERIARATKKNAPLDAEKFQSLSGKLEYFDLRELQDTITGKIPWPLFESRFGTKEALAAKFDQLAELRNGIRHSRAVGEVVRMEGEAAIVWFKQVLNK